MPAGTDKGLCDFVKTITKKSAFVVSTHADMDHVGSDGEFSEQYMHPAEFDHYSGKRPLPAGIIPIWEGDIIDLGTYKFEVIFTPGHTPGGVVIACGNQLFCGDTLFAGSCGRTDMEGGSSAQMQRSLSLIADLPLPDETQVYPGHENFTTLGRERRSNPCVLGDWF